MSKKEEDYRKVTSPKAEEKFSTPNDLEESLKDLEDYESYTNTDNLYQSDKGDRLVVEKHEPYEDAKKVTVNKKAILDKAPESLKQVNEHRDVFDKDNFDKGLLEDLKEIDELLECEEVFDRHLDI